MNVTGSGASSQVFQTVSAVGAVTPQNGNFLMPNTPNVVDFLAFLTYNVQIPAAALPGSSNYPQYALTQALALVINTTCVPPITYVLAVYNCATHILFGITPDQVGQNYFETKRSNLGFNLINPSTGIVAAASDETTSTTLASPDWAKGLTVGQLDFMKTPWGRTYLSFNQSYGPTIWGLS